MYESVVTLGLLGEHLVRTACLGVHLGEDGVRLTLGYAAHLLGLCFGVDDGFLLLDLGRHDHVGRLRRLLAFGTRQFGFTL